MNVAIVHAARSRSCSGGDFCDVRMGVTIETPRGGGDDGEGGERRDLVDVDDRHLDTHEDEHRATSVDLTGFASSSNASEISEASNRLA